MASKLEQLLERQRKLETQISEEKVKAEADKALGGVLEALTGVLDAEALKALEGRSLKVVEGKFTFNGHGHSNGNGKPKAEKAQGATNGNGSHEYVLADGRGPYATIQEALDAMGVDKKKRPQHNRWERLSGDLQKQIVMREKAQA